MNLKLSLRQFSHPLVTVPFSLLGLTNRSTDLIKADWQPPGYVFGIAWSILYALLSAINIRIDNLNISQKTKNIALNDGIKEALVQGLWLFISSDFSKYGIAKGKSQYIASFFVIIYLTVYAFKKRLPTLKTLDTLSYYMYVPYVAWISFASILSYQILVKALK